MTIKTLFPFIKSKTSKSDLLKEIVTRQQIVNMMAWASELPNPDPALRAMGNYMKIYGDMLSDPHLSGVIQQRKSGTLKLELKTEKERSDDKIVEFVNENLRYLDTHKITNEFLNAPYYGMTVSEVIWEYSDGKYWIQDIVAKPLDRFFFDHNNNLKYRTNNNKSEIIPPYKFILAQHNASYDRPHGEALLSKCFWPWTFKKGGLKFALIFMEKYGMPFIIGKQPRGAGKDKADELLNNLTSMIQDAAAVIPDDSSIEILANTSKADGSAYKLMVEFSNTEMSKAILSQTLTTEVQDKGSYATGKVHSDILAYVLMADKHIVENAWNQAFAWLTLLNFGDVEFPRCKLYEEERIDKIRAERDEIMTRQGVQFTEVYYQRHHHLAPDEFILKTPAPVVKPAAFAEPTVPPDPQTAIDALAGQLPDRLLQMQIEQTLKPVIELIQNGGSYDTILAELSKLYPQMPDSNLENMLTKLIFISETIGRADARS